MVGHVDWEEERVATCRDVAAETDQVHDLVRDRHAMDAALLAVGGLLGPLLEV